LLLFVHKKKILYFGLKRMVLPEQPSSRGWADAASITAFACNREAIC